MSNHIQFTRHMSAPIALRQSISPNISSLSYLGLKKKIKSFFISSEQTTIEEFS